MSREAQIPLVLWISAAIVAHWVGGNSAIQVARVYEDRAQIRSFVDGVRLGLRPTDTTFEILSDTTLPTPSTQPAAAPADDAPDSEPGEPDPNAIAEKPKKLIPPKEAKPPEKPPPPPEPVAKAPPPLPPPPEPPKDAVHAPPAPPPPPPPPDHRIAIRQNTPKDQEDNPTAPRIADNAHHTKDETVARIRSHDQDDPNPTLGRPTNSGPKDEVGDGDKHRIAQSEDTKGDPEHAPGEASKTRTSSEHQNPPPPQPMPTVAKAPAPTDPGSAARQGGGRLAEAATKAGPPPSPGGAGPASPEVVTGARGGYSLDPANPGGDGKSRKAGKKRASAYQSPVHIGSLGLGAPAVEGGPNLNLTIAGVEKAVGHERLRAEREADGASRRSAHRGSWETNKFERWRAAIENYDSSVKLGNQTSLNAAAVPFATYLNSIHNRLHPIFAYEFLEALDNLPPEHFLNDQKLVTHLEIVLSKDEGRIVRMGVTRPSGITAFDIVALNSVQRASPFGKAPDIIASPDGNVYLHWEFHRGDDMCGTHNAHPYLLKTAPDLPPARPLAPRKAPMPRSADERSNPAGPLLPLR